MHIPRSLAALVLLATIAPTQSTTLITDDFTTTSATPHPASALGNSGTGWSSGWQLANGFGGSTLHVEPGQGVHALTPGYRRYSNFPSRGRIVHTGNEMVRGITGPMANTVWFSLALNLRANNGNEFVFAIQRSAQIAGFAFGIDTTAPTPGAFVATTTSIPGLFTNITYPSSSMIPGQQTLLLGLIELDYAPPSTDDRISLWVNPPSVAPQASLLPPPNVQLAVNNTVNPGTLSVARLNVKNLSQVDALRIGWSDTDPDRALQGVLHGTLQEYPGNGSDVTLDIDINGVPSTVGTGVHSVSAGDLLTMRARTPAGTLDGVPFLLAGSVLPAANDPVAIPLSGVGDPIFWLDLAGIFVFADGFRVPPPIFAPVLSSQGYAITAPVPPGLSGISLMLQALTLDASFPSQIGVSDAQRVNF